MAIESDVFIEMAFGPDKSKLEEYDVTDVSNLVNEFNH